MMVSVCLPPMDEDLPMPAFLNSVSCSTLLLDRPCATQLKGIENPARWIHESHYWSIRSLNDWINHHSTTQYRIRIALSALQLLRAESSYLQKSNNVAFSLFLLR